MKKRLALTITCFVLFRWAAPLTAQGELEPADFRADFRIYKVTTNITGDGLTSQTLPGSDSTFQILHEKWGGMPVVMEGERLSVPNNEAHDVAAVDAGHIQLLGPPAVSGRVGYAVTLRIGDATPLQWLEKARDGLFRLKTMEASETETLGMSIEFLVQHSPDQDSVWNTAFRIRTGAVEKRLPVEGLAFDVGKPEIVTREFRHLGGSRENEWAGCRAQLPSEGMLYCFWRISALPQEGRAEVGQGSAAPFYSIENKVMNCPEGPLPLKLQEILIDETVKCDYLATRMKRDALAELLERSPSMELFSAPRITLGPANVELPGTGAKALMKIVVLNPGAVAGGGFGGTFGGGAPDTGGFGGGLGGGAPGMGGFGGGGTVPDVLVGGGFGGVYGGVTPGAEAGFADKLEELHKQLSEDGMVPDDFMTKKRGVISDISPDLEGHAHGVLISVAPTPAGAEGVELDYLFQMRIKGGSFRQFYSTFRLKEDEAMVFWLPDDDKGATLVAVTADEVSAPVPVTETTAP
ncbi:MAG: hypothetical protein HYV26_19655 [Candidatus Hydrogenedentes bacterium]|nr:hypothetical protein [Candidatus Hydrogenedentota bacterium]